MSIYCIVGNFGKKDFGDCLSSVTHYTLHVAIVMAGNILWHIGELKKQSGSVLYCQSSFTIWYTCVPNLNSCINLSFYIVKWRISKNTIENSVRNVCTLPDELLLKIFSFLPSSSLLTCFLTCKRLHVIAADPVLCKYSVTVCLCESVKLLRIIS